MPTYRNKDRNPHELPGYGRFTRGQTKTGNKYVHLEGQLADWFELTDHEPRTRTPIMLFSGALPSGDILGIEAYEQIEIYKASGADFVITFNEDSTNALSYPSGAVIPWDCNDDLHQISLTSTDSAVVEVRGVPK